MNQKKFWKYFIRLWVWFAVLYHIIYSQSVKYDVTRRVVPSKSCCRASLPCYIWVEGRTFSASSLSNLFGDIFLLASTPSRKRKMRRVGRLKKQNYVLSFFSPFFSFSDETFIRQSAKEIACFREIFFKVFCNCKVSFC